MIPPSRWLSFRPYANGHAWIRERRAWLIILFQRGQQFLLVELRRLRFEESMEVMMLSNHRIVAPYGLAGGEPGALGRNWIERAGGARHEMTGTDKADIGAGDIFVIETPGGGGYGEPLAVKTAAD